MTQQPFSRPGAIDLSALKRPAPTAPSGPVGQPGGGGTAGGGGSYSLTVTEENLQATLEASVTAPVVLVFHSSSRSPESTQYAQDVMGLVEQYEGRFLAGSVDIDGAAQVAQMLQIQQVPLMMVFLDARPVTQPIPGALPPEELSTLFNQLAQQLTAQGVTGRHQPRGGAEPEAAEGEEPQLDPRYAAAQQALADNDIDTAVAEYQKLVDANPADTEAAAGLAMATVLQRTQGVDLTAAREAAAARPHDHGAQTMCADLDLLGGHVDDAFNRLTEFIRRAAGDDRDAAREHLLGLFAAVGNEDPRVLRGRQNLASALF